MVFFFFVVGGYLQNCIYNATVLNSSHQKRPEIRYVAKKNWHQFELTNEISEAEHIRLIRGSAEGQKWRWLNTMRATKTLHLVEIDRQTGQQIAETNENKYK